MKKALPSIIPLSLAYMLGFISSPHGGFYFVFLIGWIAGYLIVHYFFKPEPNYD